MRTALKISEMTSGWSRDQHQEESRHTGGNGPLGTGTRAWPAAVVWPVGVEEG